MRSVRSMRMAVAAVVTGLVMMWIVGLGWLYANGYGMGFKVDGVPLSRDAYYWAAYFNMPQPRICTTSPEPLFTRLTGMPVVIECFSSWDGINAFMAQHTDS